MTEANKNTLITSYINEITKFVNINAQRIEPNF